MYWYIQRYPLPPIRIETPRESWDNIDSLFNKQDELQGYILENELVSLHPNRLETIKKLFTKFKSLVFQYRQWWVKWKDENNVLSILRRLGSEHSVFVSIFHSKREIFPDCKIPTLDSFYESLIKEQDKLIQMGVIKSSKVQYFLVIDSSKVQEKGK